MIWLIGNKGMLGSDLESVLRSYNYNFIVSDKEVDITNLTELKSFTRSKNITWIINCAAYTAVDRAEDETDLCYRINADGPENIGIVAKQLNAKVIHMSTDYVFDGTKNIPYTEEDPVNPLNVYGKSKAEGEKRLMATNPQSVIIRTAWLYGKNGNNFVYTMLRLMKERDEINVVNDQFGNPTWSMDLTMVIKKIIDTAVNASGIYNYTNEGMTNWFEFANKIYEFGRELGILYKDCKINPVGTDQYPVIAKRPVYSVLSKNKIKKIFNLEIPLWDKSLKLFMTSLK